MDTTAGELLTALKATALGGRDYPARLVSLRCNRGVLSVRSRRWTDLNCAVEAMALVNGSGPGFTDQAVNRGALVRLLGSYEPDETVTLSLSDDVPVKRLVVAVGTSTLSLTPSGAEGLLEGAFPGESVEGFTVEVTLPALGGPARYVAPFASTDYGRPTLTTICLDGTTKDLTLAATDSYRLGAATVGTTPDGFGGRKVMLPREVARWLPDEESSFEFTFHEDGGVRPSVLSRWSRDGVRFQVYTSSLLAEFPSWRGLIPTSWSVGFDVERWRMLTLARRLAVAGGPGERQAIARLDMGSGGLDATVIDEADGATVRSRLEGLEVDGSPLRVALNLWYLTSLIRANTDEVLKFRFMDDRKPVLVASDNYTAIIMPVRVS